LFSFFLLAIMNNNSLNIHVPVFVWRYVFISLGFIHRSRILFHKVNLFNLLRSCQTFSKKLHYFSFPCQHLLLSLIMTSLIGMKGYGIVVVIYISLMANNVEYLFMYLLTICMALAIFKLGYLCSCWSVRICILYVF